MANAATIKTTRKAIGENQEDFAKRFGVDQSTYSRWETEGIPDRGPARALIERVLADLKKRLRRT